MTSFLRAYLSRNTLLFFVVGMIAGMILTATALAGAPSGADTFELLTNTTTGGDNTGDGGTGNGDDLNYYYVGQSINTTMRIVSGGTTASNIEVDYDTATVTANSVSNGSYFGSYSGSGIDTSEAESFGGGRAILTGFNSGGGESSGAGTFGSISWTFDAPTSLSLTTTTPGILDIYFNTIGSTDESNISNAGLDILDDVEDFEHHVWADITRPYAQNFSHATGTTGVSITDNFTFDVRDSQNGEGNDNGSGTGVNTGTAAITFNGVSETDDDSYSCSGTFGTELCAGTVNPDPPSGIGGDSRNWEYNTRYEVVISGFQDLASASQNQLGEANGPNTMNATSTSFTTEADTIAPQVVNETPSRSSGNVATTTNIVIDVEDRKTYASGPSGVGLDAPTCQFNVTASSTGLVTYSSGTSTLSSTTLSYGYRFTINSSTNFAENEIVTVSVYDCADTESNVITTDTYTFQTVDATAPVLQNLNPDNDTYVAATGTVTFDLSDGSLGTGVDLSETVIYVNGNYWTDGGGAGNVTVTDTIISYTSSFDFNGGNFATDTTSVASSSGIYSFVIDPEDDFTEGESIPVIVYSEDQNGNVMAQEVYGLSVAAAGTDGSTFCASGTTWNGSMCTPDDSVVCGTDTTWNGSECTVDGSDFCGSNTTWSGSECIGNVTSSGGGSSGGGGGSSDDDTDDTNAEAKFTGHAFPFSRINLLKDGQQIASTVSGPDASFSISANNISEGDHVFTLSGEDPNGYLSYSDPILIALAEDVSTEITGIVFSPTLATNYRQVKQGENITIFGHSAPSSEVTIGVASENETFTKVTAESDGSFLLMFDTTILEKGDHETRAKTEHENGISDFGEKVHFAVGDETIANEAPERSSCFKKGDLNDDCAVNLVDFSIAAFWYQSDLSEEMEEKEYIFLNADGVINLSDLSVMAFHWTG